MSLPDFYRLTRGITIWQDACYKNAGDIMIPTLTTIQQTVVPLLRQYGVKKAGVFGSMTTGTLRDDSDLDLLVELDPGLNLFDFIALKQAIEEIVQRKVDLVEYDTLKPRLKERILREEIRIYDA